MTTTCTQQAPHNKRGDNMFSIGEKTIVCECSGGKRERESERERKRESERERGWNEYM